MLQSSSRPVLRQLLISIRQHGQNATTGSGRCHRLMTLPSTTPITYNPLIPTSLSMPSQIQQHARQKSYHRPGSQLPAHQPTYPFLFITPTSLSSSSSSSARVQEPSCSSTHRSLAPTPARHRLIPNPVVLLAVAIALSLLANAVRSYSLS